MPFCATKVRKCQNGRTDLCMLTFYKYQYRSSKYLNLKSEFCHSQSYLATVNLRFLSTLLNLSKTNGLSLGLIKTRVSSIYRRQNVIIPVFIKSFKMAFLYMLLRLEIYLSCLYRPPYFPPQ